MNIVVIKTDSYNFSKQLQSNVLCLYLQFSTRSPTFKYFCNTESLQCTCDENSALFPASHHIFLVG